MPRPKTVEVELRAAFDRLKNDEAINVDRLTQVTLANVAKEAGMNPNSLRRERYPELHAEIQSYVELNTIKLKEHKPKKTRVSQTKRIKNQNLKIEELMNIVDAQNSLIAELEAEIDKIRNRKIAELRS